MASNVVESVGSYRNCPIMICDAFYAYYDDKPTVNISPFSNPNPNVSPNSNPDPNIGPNIIRTQI